MSSASKSNKENKIQEYTTDNLLELSDKANEILHELERLNFSTVQTKSQQELECWHAAAVAHLNQIYTQRLADLAHVYSQDVCPESEKFKQKMTEQLKKRLMPRITKILDEPTPDPDKVEKMQVCKKKKKIKLKIIYIHINLESIMSYKI